MRRVTVALLVASLVGVGGSQGVTAQSPSPGPVGLGGRVELAAYGFALTFPDDWAWVRYSSEDFDSVMAQLTDLTSSEFVARNEATFREVDAKRPVIGQAVEAGGTCSGEVFPTDLPLDDYAAQGVALFEGQPDSFPGGATVTDVTLPASQAKRIDVSPIVEGRTTPATASYYLLSDGGRAGLIICFSNGAPADRWLSIAETFEFLPAGGSDATTRADATDDADSVPDALREDAEPSGS